VKASSQLRDAGFVRGVTLFNRGVFFDAHEVLEDVWQAAPEREKKSLQGLIQFSTRIVPSLSAKDPSVSFSERK
jgi:predicted metal-dependent hydrolase